MFILVQYNQEYLNRAFVELWKNTHVQNSVLEILILILGLGNS